jgi:hypothetical protein
VNDLIAEYFGGLRDGKGTPVELLRVCRRLLSSPGTDAARAGEKLLVFALPIERKDQTIVVRIVGEDTGNQYLNWQYRNTGGIDPDDFSGYVMNAAASLGVCVNGPENSTPEEIAALRELSRLIKDDRDSRRALKDTVA